MRFLAVGALLVTSARADADAAGGVVSDTALVNALALSHTLLDEAPLRVVEVYSGIGECGGTIASCPDVELFVIYVSGDLDERPIVYRVGSAKGWKLIRRTDSASLQLQTALPEANIDLRDRSAWQPTRYWVEVKDGKITGRRE